MIIGSWLILFALVYKKKVTAVLLKALAMDSPLHGLTDVTIVMTVAKQMALDIGTLLAQVLANAALNLTNGVVVHFPIKHFRQREYLTTSDLVPIVEIKKV